MKIIIIGCGRMGAGLGLYLKTSDHSVTVIDNDPLAFERLEPGFKGQTIAGDALDRDVLLRAGIEQADCLAALTPNDSINLVVARLDFVHLLGSGGVGIVESEIPPLLAGRMVNDLAITGEIQVVAISRGGRTFVPTLGTVFSEGDMIHIAVSAASVDRLKALMGLA